MSNTIILYLFSVLFSVAHAQKGPCEVVDGAYSTYGECKSIFKCQSLLTLVHKANKTIPEKIFLQRSHCGIDDYAPAVCCPTQNEQQQCFTPEGKPGQCVNVYSCPEMIKLLTPRPPPPEVLQFVRNSRCSTTKHDVCCGPIPEFSSKSKGKCDLNSIPPEPTTECCGIDSSFQNKIYGGTETAIDQYPWLAMTEFIKNGKMLLKGNGALISGDYVLTTATLLQEKVYGKPVNIRLGEYDTSNEGPDCVSVEGGGVDCTDGAISIPIASIVIHPMYDARERMNNIALVRMTLMAPFTDFIRPICLPTVDVTKKSDPVYFIAAGWGATSDRYMYSNIKLQVDLTYVDINQCHLQYEQRGRNITIGAGYICAGGAADKDTCKGDSTLMYKNVQRYEYIGIVSYGYQTCGGIDIPTFYTNVYAYVPWIKETIIR